MGSVLGFLFLCLFFLGVTAETDYCRLCQDHTMCLFDDIASTNCAPLVLSTGVSPEHMGLIVNHHNVLRSKVASGRETFGFPGPQPPAADMSKLTWDNELATIAQRWADQCIRNKDRCRHVERFHVGMNMFWTACNCTDATPDWRGVINRWYDQVEIFPNTHVYPYQVSRNYGAYTQMVWSRTKVIGCGYMSNIDTNGMLNRYYVCNYGPAGNTMNTGYVYTPGRPCSHCMMCDLNGLLCI